MGEIVNILGCNVKLYLDRGGRQIRLSTPSVFVRDRESHEVFLSVPETLICTMAAGTEKLMIGVQVSRGVQSNSDVTVCRSSRLVPGYGTAILNAIKEGA